MLTEIQIDAQALRSNYQALQKFVGQRKKIISVVKANAYGHGLREVVGALDGLVDAFAVDDIQELHALRFYTDKEVYVLGYVSAEDIDKLIDLKGIPVVYDEDMIHSLNKRALVVQEKIPVNIKIDALLGRQGIGLDQLPGLLKTISECSQVQLRGIYAHFSNIEDTADFSQTQKQIDFFKEAISIAHAAGHPDIETHISSSGGSMVFKDEENLCSHVRIGQAMYGLWPSRDLQLHYSEEIALKPVLRWVTHVAQVKTLPTGHPIGYGMTYVTDAAMRVAVIPQGYSDGYDRGLTNCGDVLIRGTRCPIRGRVAMNMFVVDISHIPEVKVEDEVVLLGKQDSEEVSANEIAQKIETINYEVVSRVNPLLPRVIVNEKDAV